MAGRRRMRGHGEAATTSSSSSPRASSAAAMAIAVPSSNAASRAHAACAEDQIGDACGRAGQQQRQNQRPRRGRVASALASSSALRFCLLGAFARLAFAAVASGDPELPVAVAAALAQTETGIVLLNG